MSDDKYMRAADEAWTWFVNRRSDDLSGLADVLREELERPDKPLEVGVRYKNTEANRLRIDTKFPVIIGTKTERGLAYLLRGVNMWKTVGHMYGVEYPDWFALIPDGEVRDE